MTVLSRVKNLLTKEIPDQYIRENFVRIVNFIRSEAILKGNFKFFEITFTAAETKNYTHNLGFLPKDVIHLSTLASDSATITWYYDDFTNDTIKLQADMACTVRAYVGRYEEG